MERKILSRIINVVINSICFVGTTFISIMYHSLYNTNINTNDLISPGKWKDTKTYDILCG